MTVTHYKLISTKARWLGIDFFDVILIVCVFALIHLLTSALLFDLVFTSGLYVGARILKATKPDRWLIDAIRYYCKSPYYQAVKENDRAC